MKAGLDDNSSRTGWAHVSGWDPLLTVSPNTLGFGLVSLGEFVQCSNNFKVFETEILFVENISSSSN